MRIGLVTDSTCDLSPELLKELGIEMVPLTINFTEDEIYKDIININHQDFFQKLVQVEKLPTTSQPAIGWFVEKYQEMAKEFDAIISIHLSSKLSGTCESARMAAEQVNDVQVELIDSTSASFGIGFQVLLAKRLIEEGMEFKDIVKYIKDRQKNSKIFFTVNDLSYLQKGGRIGKAQAFLGSVLNFYPILNLVGGDGELLPLEKIRGKKKIVKRMVSLVLDELKGVEKATLGFVHASEMEHYNQFKSTLIEQLKEKKINYIEMESWISAVIGCHVGPSVYGIVILKGEILDNEKSIT